MERGTLPRIPHGRTVTILGKVFLDLYKSRKEFEMDLFSPREAAQKTGLTLYRVYTLIDSGAIVPKKSVKKRRYLSRSSILDLVDIASRIEENKDSIIASIVPQKKYSLEQLESIGISLGYVASYNQEILDKFRTKGGCFGHEIISAIKFGKRGRLGWWEKELPLEREELYSVEDIEHMFNFPPGFLVCQLSSEGLSEPPHVLRGRDDYSIFVPRKTLEVIIGDRSKQSVQREQMSEKECGIKDSNFKLLEQYSVLEKEIQSVEKMIGLTRYTTHKISNMLKTLNVEQIEYLNIISREDWFALDAKIKNLQSERQRIRQTLIEDNKNLVRFFVNKYSFTKLDSLDLIQEGNIGLMNAIDKFNPYFGVKFSTYVSVSISNEIMVYITNHSRTVRLPRRIHKKVITINQTNAQLRNMIGREPTLAEVARAANIDAEEVLYYRTISKKPSSLDFQDEESESMYSFIPSDGDEGRESFSDIRDLMKQLSDRKRDVVIHRFGLNGEEEKTLEKIGKLKNLSRERIRQIEKMALLKLRKEKR